MPSPEEVSACSYAKAPASKTDCRVPRICRDPLIRIACRLLIVFPLLKSHLSRLPYQADARYSGIRDNCARPRDRRRRSRCRSDSDTSRTRTDSTHSRLPPVFFPHRHGRSRRLRDGSMEKEKRISSHSSAYSPSSLRAPRGPRSSSAAGRDGGMTVPDAWTE